jgi:hypothetical protein
MAKASRWVSLERLYSGEGRNRSVCWVVYAGVARAVLSAAEALANKT